ncbi:hypothetical protein RRG08_056784 [Elysia crispata]|uniref:Uncharacterized protein n=1 Tax=Elysia crispata TaxID=231223 RepID=A0AAE1AC52_9GAST|nr:hypothetical protein RRG08_056784 [Elysia crispata]
MNSVCPRKIRDHDTDSPKVKLSGKEKDERQLYKLFQDIFHQYQETASIHGISKTLQPQLYCRNICVHHKEDLANVKLEKLQRENYIYKYRMREKSRYNYKGSTCPFPQEGVSRPHWNQPRSERCELNRSFRLDELIWNCAWRSKVVDCNDIFQLVNTSYGKCFIFNGDKYNMRKSIKSGPREALKLRMDVNNEKAFFSQYMGAGIMDKCYRTDHFFYKSLTVETLKQQPAVSTADVFGET